MNSFFDFLVTFNSTLPAITRVPDNPGTIERFGDETWQASVSNPKTSSKDYSLVRKFARGHWTIWAFGELIGYRDKNRISQRDVPFDLFCSDLTNDCVAPETLNGHFLILARNNSSNQWHIWTNRLGTIHAYYATDGKRTALGTFFPAVAMAASRRQLDWVALSGFFGFGFFPQDRTHFDDVKILRPATHTVLDHSGKLIKQERYWSWSFQPNDKRTYDETVEGFGETLNTILTDQTRYGRIVLPISSGLDSRTAAAVVTRGLADEETGVSVPRDLWAYSYGYTSYSNEISTAARIASARKLRFQKYVIPSYLFDRIDTVLNSVEGFQDVTSTRQAAIGEEVAGNADFLLAAHWGDVWMDDMGLLGETGEKATSEQILDHTLKKIQKRGCQWSLRNLCQPFLGSTNVDSLLRDLVGQELNRFDIDEPDFRVKAFKTEQWSFRWTVPSLRMFQPAAFPMLPFYDNRMVDFCSTVPSRFVSKRRLQIDYLKRFHPDLAEVPWDVTGRSLFAEPPNRAKALSARAIKKLWRGVSRRPHVGRNWEVQFLNDKGKTGLREWLLRSGLRIHEYVAPKTVSSLLDEFFQGPGPENGYSVSSLLTFSAWSEMHG